MKEVTNWVSYSEILKREAANKAKNNKKADTKKTIKKPSKTAKK